MGVIYKLTSPNGKGYIGQTVNTFDARLYNHKSASGNLSKKDGCRALNNALRKYGWENFTKEVILECEISELDFHENYYIKKYNTLAPFGYNLMSGGNSNKKYSNETKEGMRKSALARDGSCYRKNSVTQNWPKHLGIFRGYPRISKHPNCSCKLFNDKSKTFEENLKDAKEFLVRLNNSEIKVGINKSDRSKGLQLCNGGYRVHVKDITGATTTKIFTNKNIPLDKRYELAKAYLDNLLNN